jgi:hypothetical protein
MTSTLTHALATEHRADLHAEAARHRLARAARTGRGVRISWFARSARTAQRPRLAMG